jgi:hypothetical protein
MIEVKRSEYPTAPGTAQPSESIKRFIAGVNEELKRQDVEAQGKLAAGRVDELRARLETRRAPETPVTDTTVLVVPSEKTVTDAYKSSGVLQQFAQSPSQLAASLKGRVKFSE